MVKKRKIQEKGRYNPILSSSGTTKAFRGIQEEIKNLRRIVRNL